MSDTLIGGQGVGALPFRNRSVIEQREELVLLAQTPGANRRELCRRFEISPDTCYRWLRRYQGQREAGLQDRSRRPHHSPNQTAPEVEGKVLQLRCEQPVWGGRKLRAALLREGVKDVPSASTVTAILRRHGLLDPEQGAGQPRAYRRFEHPVPNALWQMDFKGRLPCATGFCHPLTILDDHSRYALGLVACADQRTETVRGHLVTAFERYGLPERILVDNGSPWGDTWEHPYTPLTVWLLHLGVGVSHSRPYHPQTLGKDERFHGTLARELRRYLPFADLAQGQNTFDHWRNVYNHRRPHESLGDGVPADRYRPSPRSYPSQLPPLEYPDAIVRKVQPTGELSFHGTTYRVPKAFRGYLLGMRPTDRDGRWDVYFGHHRIAQLDQRDPTHVQSV